MELKGHLDVLNLVKQEAELILQSGNMSLSDNARRTLIITEALITIIEALVVTGADTQTATEAPPPPPSPPTEQVTGV